MSAIQDTRLSADSLRIAARSAFLRLNPRWLFGSPVLFIVFLGAAYVSIDVLRRMLVTEQALGFELAIALVLWLTLYASNLTEAIAEGRGRAAATDLRAAREAVAVRVLAEARFEAPASPSRSDALRPGDLILVEAGEIIGGDGDIALGMASIDESAITGESAPVLREAGGDRSAVTGGTRVLSDRIIVRITAGPGEAFLDRMIALVEGARRRKTPNEVALDVLLAGCSLLFVVACTTLFPFSAWASAASGRGAPIDPVALVALLVCLIPTTIGGLLPAIRIAGMDRMVRAGVIARSGRAVEAAGDVDVLLLDKTGTITLGARQAVRFVPVEGVSIERLAQDAHWASLADETPEGRSIVALAHQHGHREPLAADRTWCRIPFSARTRMSGVDLDGIRIRKGASAEVQAFVRSQGGVVPPSVQSTVDAIAQGGGTPLLVARESQVLGTIDLRDIVKDGLRERFLDLRRLGIRTVMITGDQPLTAGAIAAEAGVDEFHAEATPEMKLALIREYQAEGHLVAMTGDGTNDAPALAQADVAVAMNSGTQAAKEAGNMVDLDSNPTKLIEIVAIGKELLMTRGALTTFSLANDVAKYFAILPAITFVLYPELIALDVLQLASPQSAILSAVVFNALIIPALLPLALRGVRTRPASGAAILRRNLGIYGLSGLVVPFVGIKLLDLLIGRWF